MRNALLKAAVAAAAITLVPAAAKAETLTFFGSGAWTNPALWYTLSGAAYTVANKVPTSDDDAIIGSGAVCDAGAGGLHSIMSLTILLTATLNNGQFDANSYTFAINSAPGQGSTLVVNGANFNVRSSGAMNFNVANVFINSSTITFQGGSFANITIGPTFSGTTIFNEGSFVIQGGTAVTFAGNNNRFDNIGDIRGNGGTAQFNAGAQNLTLNNSGTVAAYADGNLVINGNIIWTAEDATHDGSFFADTPGSRITIQGPLIVPPGVTDYFKGPGSVQTLGGLTVNGTLQIGVPASPVLPANWKAEVITGQHIVACPVEGAGTINVISQAELNLTSGSLGNDFSGLIKVLPSAMMEITGANNNGTDTTTLSGGTLINDGLIKINVAGINARNFTFNNQSDGTVSVMAPTGFVSSGSPAPVFNNFGQWNAIGGSSSNPRPGFSGITTNAPRFNNNGTLNVTGSGMFQICGGQGKGTFNSAPNLAFVTNVYGLNNGVTFPGTGTVIVQENGGLKELEKIDVIIKSLMARDSGILDGPGTLTVEKQFDWQGGTLKGTGILETKGTTIMSGFDLKFIDGRYVVNSGTWTITGSGELNMINGAKFDNRSGALFDTKIDWTLSSTLENTPIFNNYTGAIFRKSGGAGTSNFGINFNNYGTVDLKIGRYNFYNYTQFNGSLLLNGGSFGSLGGTTSLLQGGTCKGKGTMYSDVIVKTAVGNIQMSFSPGFSPGKITINGNYTQSPDATLDIEVAGLGTAGVDYDLLEVTGTATLGGNLHVRAINGFTPGPNDTIVPLTAASISGTFNTTNAQVNYGSSALTVAALPNAVAQLLNISTRLEVRTGADVLIGGFIVSGKDQKNVLVRGLGPSLPVIGPLADPTLELHDSSKNLFTNDNWKDTQQSAIEATTIPPSNELESAIVATLPASNAGYTAILADKNGATGIGLVEVYDLAQTANSKLANISTRGLVETGDNVMIGGLILGPDGTGSARVLVRGIGPTLANSGVTNPLADPTLELHDSNGGTVASNDNWKDTQQSEIEATTIPPTDNAESAIVHTLAPGKYTAILKGKNSATGVALVELYNLP
ncbi:MAG: beta strand repeat-containing protein [Chthoniobacterales bacterium]